MAVVSLRNDSGAAVITLNNSSGGNVLNMESMSGLKDCLAKALADKSVRVVILRSDGPVFCHGMDFAMLLSLKDDSGAAEKAVSLYSDILTTIYSAEKPVACVLKGEVKAGGVGLVSACDIIIASEETTFELSEIFFGLIPANVIPYLFSRISPQKAKYLVLTARKLTAAEALGLGLIDEVFSAGELEKGIKTVMKNLFRASPAAMADVKKFITGLQGKSPTEASKMAKDKLLEMIRRPGVLEAIKNFREGTSPEWFDRFKPENPVS